MDLNERKNGITGQKKKYAILNSNVFDGIIKRVVLCMSILCFVFTVLLEWGWIHSCDIYGNVSTFVYLQMKTFTI